MAGAGHQACVKPGARYFLLYQLLFLLLRENTCKSRLRKEGAVLWLTMHAQPIMVGKAWLRELEGAACIASVARKQKVMNDGTQFIVFF